MRLKLVCALLTSVLFAVGCGDASKSDDTASKGDQQKTEPSNTVEFKTKTSEPQGDVVKIAYQIEKGEGIRMVMRMDGSMKTSGAQSMEMPLGVEMAMTLQCVDLKENGDRVVEMTLEDMKLDMAGAGEMPQEMLSGFKGRMTLGSDGKIKDIEYSGGDPAISAQLDQVFKSPGFQTFVPMPPEGMRVGEALDLAKIMPVEAMERMMNSAVPGSTLRPEIKGELVLVGTRDVDGEKSAEFAMNLVMNMAGTMSQAGTTADMDFGITVTGTQFSSLRTGFPMGTSEMKMTMRGDVEANGEEIEMAMDMTMTIDCSKL